MLQLLPLPRTSWGADLDRVSSRKRAGPHVRVRDVILDQMEGCIRAGIATARSGENLVGHKKLHGPRRAQGIAILIRGAHHKPSHVSIVVRGEEQESVARRDTGPKCLG